MTHEHGILDAETSEQGLQIVRVGIHIVAAARLAGAPMAATIMSNDAIAVLEKKQQLWVPAIGVHRPPVRKDNGFSLSPIFVEKVGAICGSNKIHHVRLLDSVMQGWPRRVRALTLRH